MGSQSGGETRTVTNNSPPQILPEGRQGYLDANEFYSGILHNPPVYEGERVAPFAPAQQEALRQGRDYFGQPQQYQLNAEQQVANTAAGAYRWADPITMPGRDATLGSNDYNLGHDSYDLGHDSYALGHDTYNLGQDNYGLTGSKFGAAPSLGGGASAYNANIQAARSTFNADPRYDYKPMTDEEMQTAIHHASEPILTDLNENVMTKIRDSSQLSGQGATSTRSDMARQKAIEGYGRTVGSSVIAPLMQQREQLTQDFDKAMQSYLQATAEGDANRATQAQVEMARINAQSHDNAEQVNAQRDIAGGDLALRAQEGASRERIAGAGLKSQERLGSAGLQSAERINSGEMQSRERISSAGLQSQERLGQAGLTSQEKRDAAQIYSTDKNAYSQRNLIGYNEDRNRELQAAGMSGDMLKNEAFRVNQLFQAGLIDQQQYQKMLDAAREKYEEPLYRQSQAATALTGMAGLSPSGGTSVSNQDGGDNTMNTLTSLVTMGAIAAKAFCSKDFKEGVVEIKNEAEIIDDILKLGIKNWHYKWEPETKMLGPILEDCPIWLHDSLPKHLNLLNLVSGLVLTIQNQNQRILELEKKLGS